MPWVRFDDQFSIHRKVTGLSDAAFRLHISAIFWCARNLTDGVVPEEDLEDVCARVRTPERFVAELLKRGAWHEIGAHCDSEDCPSSVGEAVDNSRNAVSNAVTNGWVIHDYLEYQPSKEKVLREREDNAGRQKKWREQQKQRKVAGPEKRNAVSNGTRNASVTAPRPVPSRRDGDGSVGGHLQVADARENDGRQQLCTTYGLTEDKAEQAMTTISKLAKEPVKDWPSLLDHMAGNGTIAAIVEPLQRPTPPPVAQPARRSATGCDTHPDGAIDPIPPDGWGQCLICNTHRRRAQSSRRTA